MSDVKIDDNDVLKLLNLYKQENAELKSQNESLRKENEYLIRQIADLKQQNDNNHKINPTVSGKDKISLSQNKN